MKSLLAALFLSVIASPVFAETVKTVKYPEKACAEIVSQEYSTGGGDTSWQYLEILCKSAEGKYTAFTTSWGSVAGFFGVGRWDMVDRFDYVPYSGTTLKVD